MDNDDMHSFVAGLLRNSSVVIIRPQLIRFEPVRALFFLHLDFGLFSSHTKLLKLAKETNNPEIVGIAERFDRELSNYIRKRRMAIYHDAFASTTIGANFRRSSEALCDLNQ